jgi:hypothetical protein
MLRENPTLSDELTKKLDKTLKKFTKHFVASKEK